jgi:hypothetical protein
MASPRKIDNGRDNAQLTRQAYEALVAHRKSLGRSLVDSEIHKRRDAWRLRDKVRRVDALLDTHDHDAIRRVEVAESDAARVHAPGGWVPTPGVVERPCMYCWMGIAAT